MLLFLLYYYIFLCWRWCHASSLLLSQSWHSNSPLASKWFYSDWVNAPSVNTAFVECGCSTPSTLNFLPKDRSADHWKGFGTASHNFINTTHRRISHQIVEQWLRPQTVALLTIIAIVLGNSWLSRDVLQSNWGFLTMKTWISASNPVRWGFSKL